MFNSHTKFELSTITCNEDMIGNAKCKNSRFDHPLRDLGVTHRVHLWLDGKRIVDFLLAVTELISLALTAGALLSEICRNQCFLTSNWGVHCSDISVTSMNTETKTIAIHL